MTAPSLSAAAAWGRGGGVASVYRAERRKLLAQLSTRVLALVCALGPLAFGAILSLQSGLPADTLMGVWVHASGYAVPFVVLGFGGYLGFPVLAGVLAGDLFSSEDRYGTWKTVLTRSRSRRQLFAGKVLAAGTLSLALVALAALSSLLAGLLFTGDQPLVGLSGNVLSSGECLWLVLVSWLLSVPPVLAFTSVALLFSVATRNGIVGVLGPVLVGLVMQLLELIGSGTWVHTLLVASAFNDWHGLLSAPKFYGSVFIGNGVCVLWIVGCLGASWLILRRRDFAGMPVTRRPGWVVPVRAVLGSAALIVVLGAGTSLGSVAVTQARLETSISSAFNDLTVLQQKELGRPVAKGAKLKLRANCARHAGRSQGPGDDWTCTMTVVNALPGSEPFLITPVVYDVSAKADGCYKADAPPSFVGQQMMTVAHGRSVVNPLYTIYGCFNTLGPADKCAEGLSCAQTRGTSTTINRSSHGKAQAFGRGTERKALSEAEKATGPAVMQEVEEAERREQRAAEKPTEAAEPKFGK
ncbi:MAG TPA: ABC transporter permease [Solirubrobacteraceae bacterium]